MNLIDCQLNLQANVFNDNIENLKFFNEKQFLKSIKDKNNYFGLDGVFSSKKYMLVFIEKFLRSANFENYLKERNAIRVKK